MPDKEWSEKLTWAFNSGELKTIFYRYKTCIDEAYENNFNKICDWPYNYRRVHISPETIPLELNVLQQLYILLKLIRMIKLKSSNNECTWFNLFSTSFTLSWHEVVYTFSFRNNAMTVH